MRLFGKKEKKTSCCSGNCSQETIEKAEQAKCEEGIRILGSGCAKCMELEKSVRTAVSRLGLKLEISHVTDFAEIAAYGVMTTPALVLNEKVISYGKVLSVDEAQTVLQKALAQGEERNKE